MQEKGFFFEDSGGRLFLVNYGLKIPPKANGMECAMDDGKRTFFVLGLGFIGLLLRLLARVVSTI